jgi:hypothetical protein
MEYKMKYIDRVRLLPDRPTNSSNVIIPPCADKVTNGDKQLKSGERKGIVTSE